MATKTKTKTTKPAAASKKKAAKPAKSKATAVKTARTTVTLNLQTSAISDAAASKRKLPRGTVKLSGQNKLVIDIEKVSKGLVRDQRARLVSSMGCYSNPGGPGC
jgi:hypothetical protein